MGLAPLRQLERAKPIHRQGPAHNLPPPHLQQFEARQQSALNGVLQDNANSINPPRPNDGPDLGKLSLDLTQMGLDIVGIFEPTPFADLTNTGISAFRGDWLSAGLSLAGVIPYIGDTAKLGKLGRWAKTVADAVDAAASNPAAREALEPALRKIADAIGSAPKAIMDNLPKEARDQLTAMKTKIDDLLRKSTDDVPTRGPGSPEHKASRWEEYQDRGGEWDYDRWSNTYDLNMTRASRAHEAATSYRQQLGWTDAEVTVKVKMPDGSTVNRRLDMMSGTDAIEFKTGYQTLNKDNTWEIARDARLMDQGIDVEWVFQGRASQPLLDKLTELGIPYKIID